MKWKVVNNSQPDFRDERYTGECPICRENATVIVGLSGRNMCKTDLQKTYNEYGRKCNLLSDIEGIESISCLHKCPLVTK